MENLKENLVQKIKSSPRFGDLFVSKNLKEILKERRFLFFTKNGPIEVVFNLKHYISGFLLTTFVVFKIFQFIFLSAINIFTNILIYNNSVSKTQQFTESEVKALKDIAEKAIEIKPEVKESNNKIILEKSIEIAPNISLSNEKIKNSDFSTTNSTSFETKASNDNSWFSELNVKVTDRFKNFRVFFLELGTKTKNVIKISDESVYDDFASLASPEMVPIEQSQKKNIEEPVNKIRSITPRIEFKNGLYSNLPVLPFSAPRNNKTKIIQLSKTVDLEIIELINVFKILKLEPDDININEVEKFITKNLTLEKDSDLIDEISTRFQYLDKLKDAIIYLPLKPPMQYYYVSSPFGKRIHPRTKKYQMHKGIDMAGTWQEEVRAAADGVVFFSGRNGSFGKTVKIRHKHGTTTLYGHLHKLNVKKGQYVSEGQIVGKMGSTGRVVGAHLHYEIRVDMKAVNPYDFISIGRNLLSSSILKN